MTDTLQKNGVEAFKKSFDMLLETLTCKRNSILIGDISQQSASLADYDLAVLTRIKEWSKKDISARIWHKDPTVWIHDSKIAATVPELTNRLGWLSLPEVMFDKVEDMVVFAQEIVNEGFNHIVLLGMGGSSLAPEVFMKTFGNQPGYPELIVLDSTNPASIKKSSSYLQAPK